ncbi:terminase large subunit [Streptomyces sp. SPB074]|uniref:terminase large subunit n=1 Tax=Streptomyces sp. (strain SPB074) TaxID=465543 RepID=UPI00017F0E0B|nr:terminase TerL endonuclease subunit [Streptomyces sp. SPB074]EDY42481.2 phage terminase, large subunit [Streptomyces sp. SPB074]
MSRTRTTPSGRRSPKVPAAYQDEELLARLKLSPEVAWYLTERGVPLPDCPSLVKAPEPRDAPGAAFDGERVDRVLRAFQQLRHTQGALAGQPLRPDPWQVAYILAPIFGWVHWDDGAGMYVRIIREAYVDVPRKNGKTTLGGGIALYMMGGDGEPGAQVITAAVTKEQARLLYGPVKAIVEKSPALSRVMQPLASAILHPKTDSYFKPVSSLAGAQHGLNLHCGLVDELHEHKTPELVETIESGTGSRRQPLIFIITTADAGKRESVYQRKRERVEQLARGAYRAPSVYGVVFAAEKDDDPFAEETWKKANPGYGVSPTRAYLRTAAEKAQQSPAELASFLRLHLGIRTKQVTKFLTLESWTLNGAMVDEATLAGREAYGGLDLGAVSDLNALAWLFPDDRDGSVDLLLRFWTPEDNIKDLDRRTAGSASVWVREGWLRTTPGNVTDYEVIGAQIRKDLDAFDVKSLGFDRWSSTPLTNSLEGERAPMVGVGQGYKTMSPALKAVQRLLLQGASQVQAGGRPMLRHGGNPVMAWMVDNLAVAVDDAGNVKPSKASAGDKIDGVSALCDAMSEVLARPPKRTSAYEDAEFEAI